MRYRYIDHTADIGFEIYGRDLKELFENAAFAIFDNMTEMERVKEIEKRRIKLSSDSSEELLLDWLRELLFIFSTEFFIPKKVEIILLKERLLEAELSGEVFDEKRHRIKIEIKNPTYHMFSLKKVDKGYTARIIFDT